MKRTVGRLCLETLVLVLASLVAFPLAVACGTADNTQGTSDASTEERSASVGADKVADMVTAEPAATGSSLAQEVFFPQQKPSNALGPSARIRGKLAVDGDGCLRIKGSPNTRGSVAIWPSYYELDVEGSEVRILDGEKDFVARVGSRIDTGGGEVPGLPGDDARTALEGMSSVSNELARELTERCRGPYWSVNPPEDHIQPPETG
jgi:hypothetical protein